MGRDFAAEIARARADLEREPFQAASVLRMTEEDWARDMLGIPGGADIGTAVRGRVKKGLPPSVAAAAAAHLAEAERWQTEVGTYASGSGEGLASMAAVRSFQVARAWLAAAVARGGGGTADSGKAARLSRSLANRVKGDSNGLGARHAKTLVDLAAWLSAAPSKPPPRAR